ncbi:MAG: DoxX family membrane protein [Cytophagales bacterium]
MKTLVIFFWIARIVAAIIMIQTLYFKFTASTESVYIFTTVGMEPWGRLGIGVSELIASILLFVPGLAWLGALIGIGVMGGAIFFHLTTLGIPIMGDGGYLFALAIAVMICCLMVLFIDRKNAVAFLV